jgi:hypothetical protein
MNLDEVALGNLHGVDIVIPEPALFFGNENVIAGHLPLLHETILAKGPVLYVNHVN